MRRGWRDEVLGVGNESVGEEDTRHIQEGHGDGELRPWEGGELGRPGSRKSREEATERRRGRRSGETAGAARSRGARLGAGPRSPGRGRRRGGAELGEELSGAVLLGGVARAGREPGAEFPEVAGWED